MKYYAVKSSEDAKIFTSWEDCKKYITGKKGFLYKSFLSLEEAEAYLENRKEEVDDTIPTAYIDGSYDPATGRYSFGGILMMDGKILEFYKRYEKDEYSSARNVAGEIKGAGYIISFAARNGIKEMNIYYDYIGIEKWYKGEWKAASNIAKAYVAFRDSIQDKIKVNFFKIKSHSNHLYNDKADLLAKKALGI